MRIGLISDTHGLLRPEVFDRFAGVERIVHAGDIGPPELLAELETLAPVTAVWGNTDGFDVRDRVPEVATVEAGRRTLLVVHGHQLGSPTPEGLRQAHPDADIIVYGHTHRPLVDRGRTPLVVNPGAAGPARFRLEPSVAILRLTDADVVVDVVEL